MIQRGYVKDEITETQTETMRLSQQKHRKRLKGKVLERETTEAQKEIKS